MNTNTRNTFSRSSIKLGAAALVALLLMGFDSPAARAQFGYGGFGVHIGGRNVHLDIGNPHGGFRYGGQVNYGRSYHRYQTYRAPAHLDWHDTSHFDYVPGGYVRHYNHYDHVPGRHVWHQDGHFDVHHGGHHGWHH